MSMRKISLFIISIILIVSFSACSKSDKKPDTITNSVPTKSADVATEKSIKIYNSDNKPILKIKEKKFGYKLVAFSGSDSTTQQAMAKMKFSDEANAIVQDMDGKKLFKLTMQDKLLTMKDMTDKPLYSVQAKDGGYEVQDAQNKSLYKVKKDGADYKISDDKDQPLGIVKLGGKGVFVEAPPGKMNFNIKGLDILVGVPLLLMDKLDERQRTSLMLFLNKKASKWQ